GAALHAHAAAVELALVREALAEAGQHAGHVVVVEREARARSQRVARALEHGAVDVVVGGAAEARAPVEARVAGRGRAPARRVRAGEVGVQRLRRGLGARSLDEGAADVHARDRVALARQGQAEAAGAAALIEHALAAAEREGALDARHARVDLGRGRGQ